MAFYSKEEMKMITGQFWNDGEPRKVTLAKDWKDKDKAGGGGKYLILIIRDVETNEQSAAPNFDLQDALRDFQGEFTESVTVLKITPTKTGERTAKDGRVFDEFDFKVEETGEKYEAPKEIGESIDF